MPVRPAYLAVSYAFAVPRLLPTGAGENTPVDRAPSPRPASLAMDLDGASI